jgi:hypothetical protein
MNGWACTLGYEEDVLRSDVWYRYLSHRILRIISPALQNDTWYDTTNCLNVCLIVLDDVLEQVIKLGRDYVLWYCVESNNMTDTVVIWLRDHLAIYSSYPRYLRLTVDSAKSADRDLHQWGRQEINGTEWQEMARQARDTKHMQLQEYSVHGTVTDRILLAFYRWWGSTLRYISSS